MELLFQEQEEILEFSVPATFTIRNTNDTSTIIDCTG